ncbi:hypothetical protein DL93DRAFT_2080929 [Clavulina sp. PMI_390]|nr:hypothetical protein DL93DRAFT_2080929 [Clavulina sp. PMI_390]
MARFAPSNIASRSLGPSYLLDILIGTLLNSFWTGVIHVQTYLFYQRFPKDPHYVKLIVAILWVAQTFYL